MRARVGFDVRKARDYGIGRYIRGLIQALLHHAQGPELVLFGPPEIRADFDDSVEWIDCDVPLYSVHELGWFRGIAKRARIDGIHFPHYVLPFASGCPTFVTIHDAIHLTHPPSAQAKWYAQAMLSRAVHRASVAFTVSHAARDDLRRLLPSRVRDYVVTPNGLDEEFQRAKNANEVQAFRGRAELEGAFVLCVASHRPHKNLAAAVTAHQAAGIDTDLVIPTRDENSAGPLRAIVSGAARVRILPGTTDHDLACAYRAASAVLLPSLAEGFGLPALEAAAQGAAIVATPIDAHREVLGEAALWSATGSEADLASTLRRLFDEPSLRETLAARGPLRARDFSWERTATLTLQGYRAGLSEA